MGFYLIGPLITLIPLGSISSWAFKPYCDDGLLGISPTFIPSVEEMEGGVCYTHLRNLPSLQSYFFFDTSHLDSQVSLEWPTLPAGVRFRTPSTFTRKIQPAKF